MQIKKTSESPIYIGSNKDFKTRQKKVMVLSKSKRKDFYQMIKSVELLEI